MDRIKVKMAKMVTKQLQKILLIQKQIKRIFKKVNYLILLKLFLRIIK